MKKKKTVDINYTKERVVLSDILPFETPLIFSNRHFYRLLKDNMSFFDSAKYLNDKKTAIENGTYSQNYKAEAKKHFEVLSVIGKHLFSKGTKNDIVTSPFTYKIRHKEDDYRELSVIHPRNQLEIVKFYEKYKDLIIYYCSLSPYSIRKAHKQATYTFYNDLLHNHLRGDEQTYGNPEQDNIEYESLKSYFTVKKYNNIHKFYESYQFHRAEKKYNNLYKFDISKCFDSIYTHTIAWALLNKEIVKGNIDSLHNTFGGEFDFLMQKLNSNETNGIVIGPEISRIFAEIILQQIDKSVHEALENRKHIKDCLIHKRDYEVFRYVDDYFIFYNNEGTQKEIVKEFKIKLKEYKLSFNDSKSIVFYKPIITAISIAKQKISDLFKEHLKLKEKDGKIILTDEEDEDDIVPVIPKSVYFTSNHVITRFKIIIHDTSVEYKDIMNFSLAILDKKVSTIIKKYKRLGNFSNKEKVFLHAFLQILDVAFFLYSVSPRVNSTIKICMIIQKLIMFLSKNKENNFIEPFDHSSKHLVFKKMNDEIVMVLQKNNSSQFIQVETLYLLICLSQLGREYRLDINTLCNFFGITHPEPGAIEFSHNLNYFSITVLLFYIKNIKQYQSLKEPIKEHICEKFKHAIKEDISSDTELTLLLFDTLTCPFLDDEFKKTDAYKKFKAATNQKEKIQYKRNFLKAKYKFKRNLLSYVGVTNNHIELIESSKFWFIKWSDFNFGMELESKKSQEVYS